VCSKCIYSLTPLQAPYFWIQRYTNKVYATIREAFLAFVEKQHKKHIDYFESLWELEVTKRYAKIAGSKKQSTKAGAMDPIAKMMGPQRPAAVAVAVPPAAATASPSKEAAAAAAVASP
jgi:hypothetical protein